MPRIWLACTLAAVLATGAGPSTDPPIPPEEQTLRAAGFPTDSAALLDYFRRRTPGEANRDAIRTHVRRLGDRSFAVREQATRELLQYGPAAVEPLQEALKDADLEVARRAEHCLRRIAENGSEVSLAIAAARVVARHKPPGASLTLLAYLQRADDALVKEEVRAALAALALRDGQPEPALVAALTDPAPERRAAAAEAFCRAGVAALRPAVDKLLRDPEPAVRLRVALALAAAGEKEAVAVLINLLAELPLDQAYLAEDALLRLADDKAPAQALDGSTDSQAKCRAAWAAWWRAHAAEVDLSKLRQVKLGRVLIAQWDQGQLGRVLEIDGAGRTLWQAEDLPWPLDAQLLPGNRLLLTEFYDNRVSERDLQGQLLWHQQLAENPIAAQRLPNGNTFIATRSALLEVERGGKVVMTLRLPHSLLAAQKGRDGSFACITTDGVFLRLDPTGKELGQFPAGAQNYCGFDVLPGGRVLIPQEARNQVVEFNADGKPAWVAPVSRPVSAARLPSGNVLVASRDGQCVVELDGTGRVVREFKSSGHPWRARFR